MRIITPQMAMNREYIKWSSEIAKAFDAEMKRYDIMHKKGKIAAQELEAIERMAEVTKSARFDLLAEVLVA